MPQRADGQETICSQSNSIPLANSSKGEVPSRPAKDWMQKETLPAAKTLEDSRIPLFIPLPIFHFANHFSVPERCSNAPAFFDVSDGIDEPS